MYVINGNVTYVTEGKLEKKFALTFHGEFIRQPINKSIKRKKKISNNYKPLNIYKQDSHYIFYVWFSAQFYQCHLSNLAVIL